MMRYQLRDDGELDSLLDNGDLGQGAGGALTDGRTQQQDNSQLFDDFLARSKPDPELEGARRDFELSKLAEAKGGSSYGFAEGLRDTLPALAALGIDAAVNHGRGAAGILTATANEAALGEQRRQQRAKEAGQMAIQARGHGAGGDPFLAAIRAETARGNMITGQQRQGLASQRYADAGNPESEHTKGTIKVGELKAGGQATGRLNAEHELNAQEAGDKAAIRAAETQAELDTEHGAAERTAGDKALAAGAEAQARLPAQITEKQTPGAEEQRQRELLANARTLIPDTEIVDEAAWNAASSDATRRANIEKIVSALQQARGNVSTMVDLRKQYGSKLNWDTLTDADKRVALDRMATAQQAAVGGLGALGNTGVVNAGEFPRYASTLPNGGLGLSDFTDEALGSLLGQSRDTQLEQLLGAQRQINEAAGTALGTYGIRFRAPGAPQPSAAAPAPNALPGEAVPAQLPSMQGKVPPISAANNTVTVTLNGESKAVPRELAEKIKRLNPAVEISE